MNLLQLNKPITFSFKKNKKSAGAKNNNTKLNTALSLDIGSCQTKMLIGRQKAGALFIEQALLTDTPENAFANGEIADEASLEAMLGHLVKHAKTAIKDLVFSIDSTKIIKREFVIPRIPDEDIPGLVTYEMGQYLPIDISGYSIQHKVIGSVSEDGEDKIKVAVNAVPKNMIQAYQKLFTSVGLKPVSMDVNPNSLEKLLRFDILCSPDSEYADKDIAFIDMGHSCFSVAVYGDGCYQFSQDIEMGGRMIDAMITEILMIDAEKASQVKKEICTRINAVDLDRKYGRLPANYQPQSGNEKILIELLSIMNRWAGQVDNVLHYMTRGRGSGIDKVYLYGGASFISGIGEFLESKLAVETAAVNAFQCCSFAQGVNAREAAATHTNALGAILRL